MAAMMVLAADALKDNVTAKIGKLSSSVKYIPHVYQLRASCTYSVNTMKTRVKNPVLLIIICYEANDGSRCYIENYAKANEPGWHGIRSLNSDNVGTYSKKQTEIKSSLLRRVTINNVISVWHIEKGYKVLAVRAELWFDGTMLCNYSPQNKFDLSKIELPEDWYVKGKYPDKIKYFR